MHKMTIKPTDVGGNAGGRKYIYKGILFKFAIDQRPKPNLPYIYSQSDTPNDEGAIKVPF